MAEGIHLLIAGPWPETPTTGMCCIGSAARGAGGCTCWEPVYDLVQADPRLDAPTVTRSSMCVDCAFRPDSPERSGHGGSSYDDEALDALVLGGHTFWCHQGIRRPVSWRHPSGATMPGSPLNYDPPKVAGRPYRADGLPAEVCGGWALRRAKEARA